MSAKPFVSVVLCLLHCIPSAPSRGLSGGLAETPTFNASLVLWLSPLELHWQDRMQERTPMKTSLRHGALLKASGSLTQAWNICCQRCMEKLRLLKVAFKIAKSITWVTEQIESQVKNIDIPKHKPVGPQRAWSSLATKIFSHSKSQKKHRGRYTLGLREAGPLACPALLLNVWWWFLCFY